MTGSTIPKHTVRSHRPTRTDKRVSPAWVGALLRWYRIHRRTMPWRDHPDPYAVWVSEIMLQQTQVATATPYYERFIQRFPTIEKLARSRQQTVLKTWEGLGYYARARNLQRAAQQVVREHSGELPGTSSQLHALPGIGDYTAAAIASICFGEPVPAVDGNVLRVFTRLTGNRSDITLASTRTGIREALARIIPDAAPGDFNQAVMELGALVCRPVQPSCTDCPLRRWCIARNESVVGDLPVRAKRPPVPHYQIGVGIIRRYGKILVARRRTNAMLGGLWEFPGGKQEPGESIRQTVRREVKEETGLSVETGVKICAVKHAYSHFRVTIHAYACKICAGRLHPSGSEEVRWVSPPTLESLPFPAANKRILTAIGT